MRVARSSAYSKGYFSKIIKFPFDIDIFLKPEILRCKKNNFKTNIIFIIKD